MLCEKCKRNEAMIHLIRIKNSDKDGIWLCEKCAKEITDTNLLKYTEDSETLSRNSILNGFLDSVEDNKKIYEELEKDKKCMYCGLIYDDFKKNKMLGCANCYWSFRKELIPIIKKVHFSDKHKGKYPMNFKSQYKITTKIKELNNEMKEAIILQNYEKAAIIRDEIIAIKKEASKLNE